ncbi:hypothetical protein FK004_10005 [Flavobacterium kingsejongi]|uniref:Uncharacterized protein n=1 Tax=Flavobacterium kingsejongi TaxID=1678728 RepID=A0A2S1LP79_9FLAO|nr:hypothetical protein FK004_10005 [Flavobacterium kingsejongi]
MLVVISIFSVCFTITKVYCIAPTAAVSFWPITGCLIVPKTTTAKDTSVWRDECAKKRDHLLQKKS